MTRNVMLAAGLGGAVVLGAFAFGLFSTDDTAAGPTSLVAVDAPTIKVYKSPT